MCLMIGWYYHLPACASEFEVTTLVDESLQLLVDAHHDTRAKVSLAITGSLLAHIETHRPRFLTSLGDAIADAIVELVATTYHEVCPFLIPPRYLHRQITLDLKTKQRLFSIRPTAFWSGNLAWTPALPDILSELGLHTAIIDEAHLREAHQTQLWQWLRKDSMQLDTLLVDTLMSESLIHRTYRLNQSPDSALTLRILSSDLRRSLSFGTTGALHHAWDDAPLDAFITRLEETQSPTDTTCRFTGDDGDRINPVSITQYRRLLDALGPALACVSDPLENAREMTLDFLPAHAPGGSDFWQDPVAKAYGEILTELYRAADMGYVEEDDILPLQDVFPIFWKRIARTRWYYARAHDLLRNTERKPRI
ncbi:hypothetical protein [Denitromonas halophila]|uniref:Glycoside hydrolase family 57 N-terminal domain-containing protein n=1 Tax=Denitromonas halophila TaxID=1629404 RepID=A0A557QJE4_9RHOO|nr:hypothetical protein [Denitromonas halophila]TVO53028.1 hypothetical protein FHP91_14555 [Denitromonas halophila]